MGMLYLLLVEKKYMQLNEKKIGAVIGRWG
jgi:hypothetical protein